MTNIVSRLSGGLQFLVRKFATNIKKLIYYYHKIFGWGSVLAYDILPIRIWESPSVETSIPPLLKRCLRHCLLMEFAVLLF